MADKNEEFNMIVISDRKKGGLPFSKGILANSIAITGLDIIVSHRIALDIQEYLIKNKVTFIPLEELRALVFRFIKDKVNLEYAEKYLLWQSVGKLKKPIIILIGGSTGAGKSTVATIISNRLNISRVVSTDAIREIMRTSISDKLIRPLQGSSYNAYKYLSLPPTGVNPVILGFREQVMAVNVGIEAIIKRSVEERTDTIIEGAHIVPGFFNIREFFNKAVVENFVIVVKDENLHREHFIKRTYETQGSRPVRKYLRYLKNIRLIQGYIEELSEKNKVKIIDNNNLDNTISKVMDLMFQRVKEEFSVHVAK
ncbi:MAG: zeta toxin family protein [Actinobacteria bacterium]|nr:zeta toxin family protein [Cyanobacteriota bacterium]MCL6087637.1 zeta toxin family protein [Actinomycetota bacterium]